MIMNAVFFFECDCSYFQWGKYRIEFHFFRLIKTLEDCVNWISSACDTHRLCPRMRLFGRKFTFLHLAYRQGEKEEAFASRKRIQLSLRVLEKMKHMV